MSPRKEERMARKKKIHWGEDGGQKVKQVYLPTKTQRIAFPKEGKKKKRGGNEKRESPFFDL